MKIRFTTLQLEPEFFESVSSLIENAFDYQAPHRYETDFYPLICLANRKNCHVMIIDDQVAAHIAIKPKTFSTRNESFPAGLIGGVCVNQKFQGKGLLRTLLDRILNLYKDEFAFWLLWSDLNQLYEKFGFYEIGEIQQLGSKPLDHPPSGFHYRPWDDLSGEELSLLNNLYAFRTKSLCAPVRGPTDWQEIQCMTSSQLFLSSNSYYVIHKGQDLRGIIHDWGSYKPEAFLATFASYPLWVYSDQPCTSHLKLFMALMKMGSQDLFKEFIQAWSGGKVEITQFDDSHVEFRLNQQNYRLSAQQFLTGVFGPNAIPELKDLGTPLAISGLESV